MHHVGAAASYPASRGAGAAAVRSRPMMGAWRRADRAAVCGGALQQPHGWDAQHRDGAARRRCPSHFQRTRTLQMHLYPPSQHDFCASQQARLDAQSQDDPSGSTSRSTTGDRRAGIQDSPGRAERSPSHAQESSTRKTRRAASFSWSGASQRARERGRRRPHRARASSTAGAAVSRCLAPLRPRGAASVPGAAKKHIRPHAIDAS